MNIQIGGTRRSPIRVTLFARLLLPWVIVWFLGTPSALAYHPFHICIGEMEWNVGQKHWEVGLRVHPTDLQKAIERTTGLPLDIQSVPTSSVPPKALLEYLRSHFYLTSMDTDGKHAKSNMDWVGCEEEGGWLWIYIVLVPDGSPSDSSKAERSSWSLVHQLFHDDVEDQNNTLMIRKEGKRATLRFTKGKDRHPLP